MATNNENKVINYDEELKKKELEIKELEKLEKQANLQDLQERLAEREMKRQNKVQRSLINGQTLNQNSAAKKAGQQRCNHRKGGNGQEGIAKGKGDDPQYAVLKHQMMNGDIWVRCLRCAKTWKPPVKESYYFDSTGKNVGFADPAGKFSQQAFDEALREYQEAVEFPTRNIMSGSVQFRFSDNGENFRQLMKDVTLE